MISKIFKENELELIEKGTTLYEDIVGYDNKYVQSVYKKSIDKNTMSELFIILDFIKQSNDIDDIEEVIKQLNNNVLFYINFKQKNKKLFYNSYIIINMEENVLKDESKNKILNKIKNDKSTARKIFITKDEIYKLPFLHNDEFEGMDYEEFDKKLSRYNKKCEEILKANEEANITKSEDEIMKEVIAYEK